MNVLLEDLNDQLEDQVKQLEHLKVRMIKDVEINDFDHLARLSAEAAELKGKIKILTRTIKQVEFLNSK